MFKIITNEAATVEQLAQGFVTIEKALADYEREYETIYGRVVGLQQDAMSGKSVGAKLKAAKTELEDCKIKQDACSQGMESIRERMIELIPKEAEAKQKELQEEYEIIKKKEAGLYKEFFTACAKAIVIREKIKGIEVDFPNGMSMSEPKEAMPSLNVKAGHPLMKDDDSVFLCEEVKKARKEVGAFEPVKSRMDKAQDELHNLNEMLADYRPDIEVERVLSRHREA